MTISGVTLNAEFPDHATDECRDADHLGVVFVHGVGFQKRGETLLAWSDRLIRMLAARHRDRFTNPADLVYQSEIDLHGDRLSSIEVRIPKGRGTRAQHWLLTEAFWAASFQPPSTPTMLRWLGARGAAALAAVGPSRVLRNSVYLTGIVIGVLVVYAAIRVVTSIIPIAALRNALVAPLDRLLTGWSGDMHVLLFDPAQSANIRKRVGQAVSGAAEAGFERVALVAHSGGAVASYMTLTDDVLWKRPRSSKANEPKIVTLITLGQGLNIAWRLCGVGDGASCDGAIGSGRRLTANLRTHHPGLRWHDYFSEGDTVSETDLLPPQCLKTVVPGAGDKHAIENMPSNPHGSYWDNDEEFLLPVVLRLEAAARTEDPAQPRPTFPRPDTSSRARRLLRVGMFSFTTRVLFSAMVSAIVGSALLGGARMDDLGALVAAIASAIPGIGLLSGPLAWLQTATTGGWWDAPRAAGTLLVSLALILAAVYPAARLGVPKLAWEGGGSRLQVWLIRAVDIGAAILPIVPLATWAVFALPLADSGYAPPWAVLPALAFAGIGLGLAVLRFGRWETARPDVVTRLGTALRSGVGVMVSVALLGFLVFGTLLAIVGDAAYGDTRLGSLTLGAAVVWLLFKLLGGVANWRWDAWDDQEREQFRQVQNATDTTFSKRPWGRRVDLLVIGFGCAAAVTLGGAIGAPFVSPGTVSLAGGVVVAMVVMIWIIGAGQDASNSRSGVEPAEMTPLPTTTA